IMDIVHQTIGKALDQVGVEHQLFRRWTGHDRGAPALPDAERAPADRAVGEHAAAREPLRVAAS
ncbi:MAG TPA: hypothetical protein PK787_05950, partial [Burkholderiaceae bacterium]|nr:hypothetical protein [Burkholderiaceae bacterium]